MKKNIFFQVFILTAAILAVYDIFLFSVSFAFFVDGGSPTEYMISRRDQKFIPLILSAIYLLWLVFIFDIDKREREGYFNNLFNFLFNLSFIKKLKKFIENL
jgi:hypothetical protein